MTIKTNEKYFNIFAESFYDEFEFFYKTIDLSGKKYLLRYVNSFFRRWFYSTQIQNTEISPAYILNKYLDSNILAVKFKSKSRISSIVTVTTPNTIDNLMVVRDLKVIYDNSNSGIIFNEFTNIDDEFYTYICDKVCLDDPEYIEYLLSIAYKLNILKLMPSIGITMLSNGSDDVLKLPTDELFKKIIDATIDIAVDHFSLYTIDNNDISSAEIKQWLTNIDNVDKIFEKYFKYEDMIELMSSESEEYYSALMDMTFEIGIMFDKYFLTPFSTYLGLIIPSYATPYSLYPDMNMFLEMANASKKFENDNNMTIALYAPCTSYYPTKLCCQFFDNEIKLPQNIYNYYTRDKLVEVMTSSSTHFRDEIAQKFYPPYNIDVLRVSLTDDNSVYFDISMPEKVYLTDLADFINLFMFRENGSVEKFMFYTEPKNIFTTFEFPEDTKRPDNKYIELKNLLANENSAHYSLAIVFLNQYMEFDFKIDLLEKLNSLDGVKAPNILSASDNFSKMFFN